MKWEVTEKGYKVPIYSEEEKRSHIPHWCADVITEEQSEGIKSIDIPENEMTPELKERRKKAIQMLKAEIEKSNKR